MRTLSLFGAAILACAAVTHSAHAQVITNAEIDRGLSAGARNSVPFNGEPYTQRYGYFLGDAQFYIGGSGRNQRYMDYLDKVDRAAKFGYAMPVDPYFGGPPIPHPDPTVTPPPPLIARPFLLLRRW